MIYVNDKRILLLLMRAHPAYWFIVDQT